MVKGDESVVLIDFEPGWFDGIWASDIESEIDIVDDLLIGLQGEASPCSGSGSLAGTLIDETPG